MLESAAHVISVHPHCLTYNACLCRFQQNEDVVASSSGPAPITLASTLAHLCDTSLAEVHNAIQDSAGACSNESSFSGGMNDENATPEPSTPSPLPSPATGPSADGSAPPPPAAPAQQPLTLLQQLHALQTFSAALYTQDMVSEVFIHSIIDHVRYGSTSWPPAAKDTAVSGVCDMFKFCGKRLENLGTLKSAMPDVYASLELLAAGDSISAATKANIGEVLALRQQGWQAKPESELAAAPQAEASAPQQAACASANGAAPRTGTLVAPQATVDEAFGFSAMLSASGVKVEPSVASGGLFGGVATGGFPYMVEPDEPPVKMEDMLAALRGTDM